MLILSSLDLRWRGKPSQEIPTKLGLSKYPMEKLAHFGLFKSNKMPRCLAKKVDTLYIGQKYEPKFKKITKGSDEK